MINTRNIALHTAWHIHVDSDDHAPWAEWFAASSVWCLQKNSVTLVDYAAQQPVAALSLTWAKAAGASTARLDVRPGNGLAPIERKINRRRFLTPQANWIEQGCTARLYV